jgi:hypothetical protein
MKFLTMNFFFYIICIALPTFLTATMETVDIMDHPQAVELMFVIWASLSLACVLMSHGFSKTIDVINDNCDDFTTFRLITVVYVFSFALLYLAGFNLIFQYFYL